MSAFYYLVPAESRHKLFHETWGRYIRRRLFRRGTRYPTGGVQVIYRHVGMLRRHGIDAQIVHLGRFRVDWFAHDIQPMGIDAARARMLPEDVLVVPERIPQWANGLRCRRKLAFVQNWGLVEKTIGRRDYAEFGFTGVVCCGVWLRTWMGSRTRLPVWQVRNGIDLEKFTPDPQRRKPGTLLYLRRKPTWVLGGQAIRRLSPGLRQTLRTVVLPHDLTQDGMVAAYRQADVFVALGFPEGFSLPPLEAMACGCAVVGFAGGGGLDFMTDGETALVVQDGDVAALAHALERVLTHSDLKEKIRLNGHAQVHRFGLDVMEADLMRLAGSVAS
jgi:glycosyltransferase involved in cell wall biosynthesis